MIQEHDTAKNQIDKRDNNRYIIQSHPNQQHCKKKNPKESCHHRKMPPAVTIDGKKKI